MSWSQETLSAVKHLKTARRRLNDHFVARERAVELMVLAAVCHEHLLLIGPPGTAKTALVSRFTDLVDARGFHYLLSRFTEPTEIFGPLDLEKFKKGTYHIVTAGMLPEAQIAFLDEVFQGSSAILNALLTLVNERVYHNGSVRQDVPLISLVGASNDLPNDPGLKAFADRFALRHELGPVADEKLGDLIGLGWELEVERIEALAKRGKGGARMAPAVNTDELAHLHHNLARVKLDAVQPEYSEVIREMRAEGMEVTDRQAVKGIKLVAGAALLREAEEAGPQDLWPLGHIWGRPSEAEIARSVVQPRVEAAGGPSVTGVRTVAEIRADLNVLNERVPAVRTESALGAHLMALNRLRRETLRDHRTQTELVKDVETSIRRAMSRLEETHV